MTALLLDSWACPTTNVLQSSCSNRVPTPTSATPKESGRITLCLTFAKQWVVEPPSSPSQQHHHQLAP